MRLAVPVQAGSRVGLPLAGRRLSTEPAAAASNVLTEWEVAAVLAETKGTQALMTRLLYGTGMPRG